MFVEANLLDEPETNISPFQKLYRIIIINRSLHTMSQASQIPIQQMKVTNGLVEFNLSPPPYPLFLHTKTAIVPYAYQRLGGGCFIAAHPNPFS